MRRHMNKVDLTFLEEMLRQRGFSQKWISIIHCLIHRGLVGIRINDQISNFFLACRGFQQGDPLSPILFYMVVDVFSKMLNRAPRKGLIFG
jgi:hypothetical protein